MPLPIFANCVSCVSVKITKKCQLHKFPKTNEVSFIMLVHHKRGDGERIALTFSSTFTRNGSRFAKAFFISKTWNSKMYHSIMNIYYNNTKTCFDWTIEEQGRIVIVCKILKKHCSCKGFYKSLKQIVPTSHRILTFKN